MSAAAKPRITANQVTFLRLALIPLACWLLYQGDSGQRVALVFATLVGCTDFVDGYLARKHGPTRLGGLMDPIADKVFIAATFIPAMTLLRLPAWMIAALFVREFLVTAARTSYERRGLQLKSSYLSRYKTWVQMCGVGVLFMLQLLSSETLDLWLGILAVAPLAFFALRYLLVRKQWKGASWFSASFALLLATHRFAGTHATAIVLLYFIVGITWASGLGYLTGVHQLRGRGATTTGEIVRLSMSVLLPCLSVAVAALDRGPAWAVIALLSFELAHGGLDNLLAHHHAEESGALWGGRLVTECLLLGAALVAPPSLRASLVVAGFAVSLLGLGTAFVQKRRYYLEEKPRIAPRVKGAAA